jgi:NTP pyrophosphatase (non-canonical NTP hydrolase)
MNFNEYQELSKRTMPQKFYGGFTVLDKSNYAMGLAGESGEVVDLIKKIVHHRHEIRADKLEKELGDVLHYLSGIATMYNLSLEHIAIENIEKLKKRYPNGFNTEDSIKRVDAHD